jgi:hypothetical protein
MACCKGKTSTSSLLPIIPGWWGGPRCISKYVSRSDHCCQDLIFPVIYSVLHPENNHHGGRWYHGKITLKFSCLLLFHYLELVDLHNFYLIRRIFGSLEAAREESDSSSTRIKLHGDGSPVVMG